MVAASSALGQLTQSGVVFQTPPGSTDTFSGTFQLSYPTSPTQGATEKPVSGSGGFVTFFTQTGTSPILQGNPPQVTGGQIYSLTTSWAKNLQVSSPTTSVLQDGSVGNTFDLPNGTKTTVYKRSVSAAYVLSLPEGLTIPVGQDQYKVVIFSGTKTLAEASLTVSSPVGNQTVAEGTTLALNLAGIDSNLGPETLFYEKVEGPEGLLVDEGGNLTWTPTEAQGPSSNPVKVRVTGTATDGTEVNLERSFNVIVTEVNTAPSLNTVRTQTIAEGSQLQLNLVGTDEDIPSQALTYSRVSGPSGLVVSPSGVVTWTPSEAQGPGSYNVTVRVSDGNLYATQSFIVEVTEVNTPPEFAPFPGSFSIVAGSKWQYDVSGLDQDLPRNSLTYRIESGPLGMTVKTVSVVIGGVRQGSQGRLEWAPTSSQVGSHDVVLSVFDGSSRVPTKFTVVVTAPSSNVKTLAGVGIDGYLNGALVFFDGNLNSALDGSEPSTLTDRDGNFSLNVDLDVFDTNGNGVLDFSEGRLVLSGGIDMSTGTESGGILTAPPGATVVTPLTSLVESALRSDPTIGSVSAAEALVESALGLPDVDLSSLDTFAAVKAGDSNAVVAVQVQAIAAQVSDTIRQVTTVVQAASSGSLSEGTVSAAVSKVLTDAILTANTQATQIDLASTQAILDKIEAVSVETAVVIPQDVKAAAADVVATSNEFKQRIAETASFDPAQALVEVSLVQAVSQVKAVEALANLGSGDLSADDVLVRFTGEALEQRIAEVPAGDSLATDVRPGTFRMLTQSALVSESGVNYDPLIVKREDGAFGQIRVQLVFKPSPRLKQQVIDLEFRDGEIMRTLAPSDVLVDDDIPQADEDFVVELKLASDAPQGSLLAGQAVTTLRVIDNDTAGSVGFEASSFKVREGGSSPEPVALIREGGLAGTIRVNLIPTSGTAVTGQDVSANPVLVEFLPGQRRKVVNLGIVNDVSAEGDEAFTLGLALDPSSAFGSGLIAGSTSALVTILDDDVTVVDTRLEVRLTATGAFRVRAWGTLGSKHRLESSSDLKTWSAEGSTTFTTAGALTAIEIVTEVPVAAGRFLRLVAVP